MADKRVTITMRRVGMLLGLALALFAVGATAAERGTVPAVKPDGQRLYLHYCSSCHGPTGGGDGPDAAYLSSPPRNLREGFLNKYSTDELVGRVLAGRELTLALDQPALRARAGDVEAIVAYMNRIPTIDWQVVEPGWEAYVSRCEACHGAYGRPPKRVPPGVGTPRDLSDPAFQKSVSDEQLMVDVRHGHKGMPALFPRLPEADGPPLVAFVRLLSPGFELYTRYCANCHGDDGHPVTGLLESMPAPTQTFDRRYFASHDPEQIRNKVWHMLGEHEPRMPHFRWTLTEAQARAIVEYLKQTEKSPRPPKGR